MTIQIGRRVLGGMGRVPRRGVGSEVTGGSRFRFGLRRPIQIRGTTDDRRDDEPPDHSGEEPDADLLREMIGDASQRLMDLEVGALTGASYGEKNPERLAQRNGYRKRDREAAQGLSS